jgi:hypothetical protein
MVDLGSMIHFKPLLKRRVGVGLLLSNILAPKLFIYGLVPITCEKIEVAEKIFFLPLRLL